MKKYLGLIKMKWRRLRNQIFNLVLILLLLFLSFVVYGTIPNKWYQVLAVTSGSMSPAIRAGDAIVIKRPPPLEELEKGMIVTFVIQGRIVTHRIHQINHAEGYLVTKGDANQSVDHFYHQDGSPRYLAEVNGVYVIKIPCLGYLLKAPDLFAGDSTAGFNDTAHASALTVGVAPFTPTASPDPTATPTASSAAEPASGEDPEQPEPTAGENSSPAPTDTSAPAPSPTPAP